MTSIAIFDYGAGNIFSLKNSFEREGIDIKVINNLAGQQYDGLLLPGVGNFDPAVRSMAKTQFSHHVDNTTPVLGICLGMELFFEASQEGMEKGLGIMEGNIVVLPSSLKVPHMGWNNLEIKRPGRLLEGVKDGSWAYFVHSYRAEPVDYGIVTAESDYGVRIPAVVEQGNYFGTQFHPEKSGTAGKIMIRNFIRECKR